MAEKDGFADRKRALEENYFQKKERELIEKMRRRAAAQAERQELAAVTGVADEEILTTLQELGYTRETVRLLYLVPLVQVAWASGSVTKREREMVVEAANLCGVSEGSPVHEQLSAWLDKRPEQEFFDQTLCVIRDITATLPAQKRLAGRSSLVTFCTNIAAASGGILGFGNKISQTEEAVIERIATELEQDHQDAARQVLETYE
jgi:uncharacterized tellurite resistance protein B-like protein